MAVPLVVGDILAGQFDDELDQIVEAIKARRQQVNRNRMFEFQPGDRIVGIGGRNNGDGWDGVRGVFVKRRETKVLVRMDAGQRSKWSGREVVCPPSMIRKEQA